ncbi:la-related protein 1-like [Paramacrobiotus metropolitanus]|uniref:la-related protein 1-like n=1 Tax=Paramacrobiotus metropolitanus TaxID=2943436 RepID=UPI002445B345|nr:la-related protein 1-like [Paramacrobiotus metropolitanus]
MNGAQFFKNMIARRECLDFTRDFNDPRQWPALGERNDAEQKKKLPAPIVASSYNPACHLAARPFIPRQKHTTSESDQYPVASKCSSLSSGIGSLSSERKSESDCSTSEALATSSAGTGHPSLEDADGLTNQEPASDPFSNHDEQGEALADLQRRNSADESAATRKKGTKTKWIPLELPAPRLSMQQKLRQRYEKHREAAAAQLDSAGWHWRPREDSSGFPERSSAARPAPRTYGYTGSYYSYSNNAPSRAPYHPSAVANRGAAAQQDAAFGQHHNAHRQFYRPRPKFSRKIQGFRNREIMYDSEFAGRDGDQFSDGADDISLTEGYDYHYYTDGSRTPGSDWGYYPPPTPGHDAAYLSAVDGFSTSGDEYGGAYDYYGDSGMESSGYYLTEEEELFAPAYVPQSEAELKEMIRTQIEYYFSADNLQKDFFLRRNMAEDGSVLLSLVASFQRVRSLSQDFYMILEAVRSSTLLELMDGFMVRSRDAPEAWPIKEDDETGSYYYMDGEAPPSSEEGGQWTYYTDDDVLPVGGESPSERDDKESGHCEEDYDGEAEDEEALSLDGSELSELSTGVKKSD